MNKHKFEKVPYVDTRTEEHHILTHIMNNVITLPDPKGTGQRNTALGVADKNGLVKEKLTVFRTSSPVYAGITLPNGKAAWGREEEIDFFLPILNKTATNVIAWTANGTIAPISDSKPRFSNLDGYEVYALYNVKNQKMNKTLKQTLLVLLLGVAIYVLAQVADHYGYANAYSYVFFAVIFTLGLLYTGTYGSARAWIISLFKSK